MAWSDAARAAAAEARRRHRAGKKASYKGKHPGRIATVVGVRRGVVRATTNAGRSLLVHAKNTKGVMPQLREHISKYMKLK